jgi:hypothetical protein
MTQNTDCPAFRLLLQSVRLDDPDDAVRKAEEMISTGAVDWDGLFERAKAHCVRPQMAKMINRITSPAVPDEFREKVSDVYRQNLSLQLRNVAEFFRVKDILDEAGIMAIPFKGFWLAHEFYGSLADREGGDTDLFICFDDLDRVCELMTRSGYRPEVSASPAFMRKIKKESAEYNFERDDGDGNVFHLEFHWKIGSSAHGMDISLDDLLAQTVTGTLHDRSFPVVTPSAHLLLAVMHHGGKDPFIWLKHVSDIGHILMKDEAVDWGWVVCMARRYDVERLLYLAMRLASVMTGMQVRDELKAVVEADDIRRLADGRMRMMQVDPRRWDERRYRFSNLVFHLRSRTRMRIRAAMLMQACRSAVVGALAPERLLRVYLKKRYRISRDAV